MYAFSNIKSAKKRVLVNRKKAERETNALKSAVKTSMTKVEAAVAAKDKEAAVAALQNAISTIDKAATKGVFITKTQLQENCPAFILKLIQRAS